MNCEIPYSGLPVYGPADAAYPGLNAVFPAERVICLPMNAVTGFSWEWKVGVEEGGNRSAGTAVWVEMPAVRVRE